MAWDDARATCRCFTQELIDTAHANAIIKAVGQFEQAHEMTALAALRHRIDG
jgi:hypothetical protein